MMTRTIIIPALLFSGISLAQPVSEMAPALSVSPGGIEAPTWLSDPCPTFSWGSVPQASGYELAVFPLLDSNGGSYREQSNQGKRTLDARIAAPSLSWTPGGDHCLNEEGRYVWFVRATTADSEGDWSEGRHFELDLGGGLLAETVRQEISNQLRQPDTWKAAVQAALGSESGIALGLPGTVGVISARSKPQTASPGDPASDLENSGVSEREVISAAAIYPNSSAFRISGENGVLFDGSSPLSETGIPAEGEGVRFMWYPGKAALRAGYALSDHWDDVNIGNYSTAMGSGTTASGNYSMAWGLSTASGRVSTAWGSSTASGILSTAMGEHTTAIGRSSTAMGWDTTASGHYSTVMGTYTTASGRSSTAMGSSTHAGSYAETVIGRYNTSALSPSPESWVETDRLFVIGNGSSVTPSDAMVVRKNGNTGIGISYPAVPLQVGGGSDCKPASGGYLVTNITSESNVCIDANEIMARNNGTTSALYINNDGGDTVLGGYLVVNALQTGGTNDLCRGTGNYLASCSSSIRYKEEIASLELGLETVQQLDPVTFTWKEGGDRDLGFIAEEIAQIDPLLTTYNDDGEIEGVKYKQLTAVLVNAVKEQQQQITSLRQELQQYQQLALEVAELKQQVAQGSNLLLTRNK